MSRRICCTVHRRTAELYMVRIATDGDWHTYQLSLAELRSFADDLVAEVAAIDAAELRRRPRPS